MSSTHDPSAGRTPGGTPPAPSTPPHPVGPPLTPPRPAAAPGPHTAPAPHASPARSATQSTASSRPVNPGDRDLPWKATAERRDLWGPRQSSSQVLQGPVIPPGAMVRRRPRRNPLAAFGLAVLSGGAVLLGAAGLAISGLLSVPIAIAGGLGVGLLASLGAGGLALAIRPRGGAVPLLSGVESAPTGQLLQKILDANTQSRGRIGSLRPRAADATAATALRDAAALIQRIDALVATEELQRLVPSDSELILLDGIATRYVPELLDAAEDVIRFLVTFQGSAREDALRNLESINQQLGVLTEGVEQIEQDVVAGVSRSLEVHSEFLSRRFADQNLPPVLDV